MQFLQSYTLEEIEKARAEADLAFFVRKAWEIVEPGTEYVHGRHIDAILEHLEAATRGEIKKLIINIPPRHMKSLLVSVFWPTWVWTTRPDSRWLFASYAQSLSIRDSLKCRRIIESPWYQKHWGHKFRLATDQNVKSRFENTTTGYRIATSVGGAATGEGGHFIVVDDPHNVQEADSEPVLNATTSWWDESMATRTSGRPDDVVKVIIMQRVSERDLSEHCLQKGDYVHLCLPGEFEPDRKCVTAIGWEDWRSTDGEILWPERYSPATMMGMKLDMGSYAYAGQVQQRPAPRGGGMFKKEWFSVLDAPPADRFGFIRYWDRAATEDRGNNDPDWTVGTLMSRDAAGIYYVEDVVRFRGTPLAVKEAILNTARRDGIDVAVGIEEDPGSAGKAEAADHIRNLAGFNVRAFPVSKSKETRATPFAAQAEAGNVMLLRGSWNTAWLDELCVFPSGLHDDQVDSASGAFNYIAGGARLLLA